MASAGAPRLKQRTRSASKVLRAIAADAEYWWERLEHRRPAENLNAPNGKQLQAQWGRWCQVVAEGDWDQFCTRLRWNGIKPQAAVATLSRTAGDTDGPLPRWARTINQIVSRRNLQHFAPSILEERDPIPFEGLLEPGIHVARAQLLTKIKACDSSSGMAVAEQLSPAAHRTLERMLLRRLSSIAGGALYREFCLTRPYGLTVLGVLETDTTVVQDNAEYKAFVERISADGLLGFFRTYPVLARLLATAIDQWVEACAELIERLTADRDAIQRFFEQDVPRKPRSGFTHGGYSVTEIQASLSDTHNGGRSVALLTFANGHKLVYKPKNLGLEKALNAFLEWCNQGDLPLKFHLVRVLDRGSYGWCEYVEQLPCADLDSAKRFYERAGMLLCVLHVLRATDCHHGNLIASGEHPVLIDAETLLHPRAKSIDPEHPLSKPDAITRDFLDSVLRTLLLPEWHLSGDGQTAYDISGLGGSDGNLVLRQVPGWLKINTDSMVLHYRTITAPVEKNVVRLNGTALSAGDFETEIRTGFEKTYQELTRRKEELLRPGSPLTAMRKLPMRFVFRATRIYAALLTNACSPQHLSDGLRFSIELDQLSRAFLESKTRPAAWPLLGAELRALGQLDIPYFAGKVGSDAITIGKGNTLPHYFESAGLRDVFERIELLGEADLRWQLALIRGSFQAKIARNSGSGRQEPEIVQLPAVTPSEMTAEAVRLALELDRHAIFDRHGVANWLGLSLVAETERVQLRLIDDGLYEGRLGVALFLAALHRSTGAERPRRLAQLALASVRNLCRVISREGGYGTSKSGMPGPAAVGSMIYALVKIGEFLGEAEPLELAHKLTASTTADVVATDRAFDVLAGSAGAILGLLSLHRATLEQTPLVQALRFGDHLVEHRFGQSGVPRAWQTVGPRPLAGFSHGAAGISYSLLRLYDVCGDERFRSAALEGIEYERSLFSPAHCNWPDLRVAENGGEPTFPDQWCHGAAGIALARLGSRAALPSTAFDAEIETALETTQRGGPKAVDHLCCGNMGRIEAVWVGAHRLGRADWHDTALANASSVLARARQSGSYQLFSNLPCDVFNPGLFRGLAGIGYQWLRLAFPKLPSVLLWE